MNRGLPKTGPCHLVCASRKSVYDYDNMMLDGRTNDQGVACGFGGCRYSRPADRGDNFTNLSPKIGLSYPA